MVTVEVGVVNTGKVEAMLASLGMIALRLANAELSPHHITELLVECDT